MTTDELIARLRKSARNAANATNRAQREAAQAFLIRRADELRARRDELAAKLEARWEWLDANDPGDTANYHARESRTIDLLHEYEAICDALDEAAALWLQETEVA